MPPVGFEPTISAGERAAVDLRLRPRGHWDRLIYVVQNYIVIHNYQFTGSINCIYSYMFRLIYRAIFRIVFRVVCMYSCWCFESYVIWYYK